jgi:hypothetical protein
MTKLEQIEQIRQRAFRDVMLVLAEGISPGDVTVEIDIHNQVDNGELAQEAREIGWLPGRYEESAWYSSAPSGAVQVYLE